MYIFYKLEEQIKKERTESKLETKSTKTTKSKPKSRKRSAKREEGALRPLSTSIEDTLSQMLDDGLDAYITADGTIGIKP